MRLLARGHYAAFNYLCRFFTMDLLAIAGLGLLLGMRHATDPDHVLAVTTILSRERKLLRAAWVGATWGVGHSVTVFIAGTAILWLRVAVSPRVGLGLELAVAFMLIALGARNLARLSNREGSGPEDQRQLVPGSFFRPVVIGVVHGLAGTAAIALLVLAVIPSPGWGMVYLAVFGAGTTAGMVVITTAIGKGIMIGGKHLGRSRISFATGVASLLFGLWLTYQVGIVQGLFTGSAAWVAR